MGAGYPGAVFELRPANAADTELLWRIQRRALGSYVTAVYGTDAAQQRRFFDQYFRVAAHEIIQVAGEDAGYLFYERRGDHLYLGNLALLPEFQRRGVGAAVLRHVLGRGNAQGLPVRLQVLRSNPARNFYARQGFELVGETATHWLMARAPDGAPGVGGMLEEP